jgi:hypothetical protein
VELVRVAKVLAQVELVLAQVELVLVGSVRVVSVVLELEA